jgi:hypothetical protein
MLPAADEATVLFLMPIFRKPAENSFTSLAKTKKRQNDALFQWLLLCEQPVFHMHHALQGRLPQCIQHVGGSRFESDE